jgi:hypothetical protein
MCATHSGPQVRFLCDQNLGRLAKWLRILGFDTEYMRRDSDERMRRAMASGRIVLTRRSSTPRGTSVHIIVHDRVADQLRQLGMIYDLSPGASAFSRCTRCNAPLEDASPEAVKGLVPDYVHATQASFARCPSCGRIYWRGTHTTRICDRVKSVLDTIRP